MQHEHISQPLHDPPKPAVGMDRRRPRWTLWTLIGVAVLTAFVIAIPLSKGLDPVDTAVPGPDRETVGTTGALPVDEAVPGATAGPTAEGDYALYPARPDLKPNTVAAHMDHQPLYVVDATPVEVNDNDMIVEEIANQETERAANYMLYVPSASAETEDDAAQFYYLKVDHNKFLKVSPQPVQSQ